MTTIWYSGHIEPVPMLHEEILAAHRRLEDLLGERDVPDPALCILCFDRREALLKLFKQIFPNLDLSIHLGLYLQRPWNVLTLCTEEVAGRIENPRSLARSLYSLVLLEQALGRLPAPWLQAGLAQALSSSARPSDRAGLNRRMLAILADGTAWSDELFTSSAVKISKLLTRPNDPLTVRRSDQFRDQACSTIEYLIGEQAPAARKAALRWFLRDGIRRPGMRKRSSSILASASAH